MGLSLSSPNFQPTGLIPSQFTCEGEDISPALAWQGTPPRTQSFVLIMDDPDAPMGTWDHWIWFNLPLEIKQLDIGASLPKGAASAANSWGKMGYGGPCPPSGKHRYFFKLFALDTRLDLPEGIDKASLMAKMQGHVLDQAELIGLYQKKQ